MCLHWGNTVNWQLPTLEQHFNLHTSGETDYTNDTLTQSVTVQDKITAFPYLHTFGNNTNWSVLTENSGPGGSTALWVTGIITNPAGVSGDTAARCNFYGPANNSGRREVLRSPVLDLTALTNPELNFSLAYRTYNNENDTIEVLVSTNAGLTFFSATTVYNKSNSSAPSLATRPPSNTSFFPDSASQWRHESIDLSNVTGLNNVVLGFRGKSRFGNNAWIDKCCSIKLWCVRSAPLGLPVLPEVNVIRPWASGGKSRQSGVSAVFDNRGRKSLMPTQAPSKP